MSCKCGICPKDKETETAHPQAWAELNDRGAWVDEEMVELIEDLWGYGVDTLFSCQGGGKAHGVKLDKNPYIMVSGDGAYAETVVGWHGTITKVTKYPLNNRTRINFRWRR